MAPYNRQAQVGGVVRAEVNMMIADEQDFSFLDPQEEHYIYFYILGGDDWEDYKMGRRWTKEERWQEYLDSLPYWNPVEEKWEF